MASFRVVSTDRIAITIGEDTEFEQVRGLVAGRWIDELVVDAEADGVPLRQAVRAGRMTGRPVRVVAKLNLDQLPPALAGEQWRERHVAGRRQWVLLPPGQPAWKLAVKRLSDVMIASLGLLLLSPLMAMIAIGVRLSSAGPVFYRWRVVGRNGRPFTGYKFRTMVDGADQLKASLLDRNEMEGPVFKLQDDPRVTSLGRYLRRYSLDELPQLWSVVRGQMSLVGPRPALPEEYQRYQLWHMRRLSVRPGITCLWQVQGRNAIRSFGDWARLDLRYIDHWSLRLDATILARTVVAVFRGTGH